VKASKSWWIPNLRESAKRTCIEPYSLIETE
jgi:hypothetical protein